MHSVQRRVLYLGNLLVIGVFLAFPFSIRHGLLEVECIHCGAFARGERWELAGPQWVHRLPGRTTINPSLGDSKLPVNCPGSSHPDLVCQHEYRSKIKIEGKGKLVLSAQFPGDYGSRPVARYNGLYLYDPSDFARILYELIDPRISTITVDDTLICP